jgi:alkylation response protein AidB-like acyl-CoA dehydrogenase
MDLAAPADGYFTDERHDALRMAVRRFAETEVAPRVAEMESTREVASALSRLIAAQGWLGVTIPAEYGGMGLGHLAKTVIIEELARVSGAMGAMVQASQLGVAKIVHFGNETQKRAWLPAIAAGECLPTIAVTEPESGGHVLGMAATAHRDGDDYILNGRKVYVGNSHVGDLHGVVVRTGAEGGRGLTAFLVEATRPGVSVTEHKPSMGLHGFSFGELVFRDCRVPAANRLGAEGDGLPVAYSSSVLYGRPNLTAVALGIHWATVADTLAFSRTQQRYGQPLHEVATVKQKLGEMVSRLMTARLAAYHAAHLLDRGLPCDAELMNAKVVNVESAIDSARTALEVHGAAGLDGDRPIQRYVRDAYHIVAPAGTTEIQRLRLAELGLGTAKGQQWSVRLADRLRPDPLLAEEFPDGRIPQQLPQPRPLLR